MDIAVESKKLSFSYSRRQNPVLNQLDISVSRGIIYGLLGPSGCGKTTLLRCIVGRLKPKSGDLRVFGKEPGENGFFIPGRGVGYMPQDTSLYGELTVEENLTYFGTLFNLPKKEIAENVDSLLALLEIPKETTFVNNLSGGQKRRLSFAAALIHKPPLLILDEPTVGVDPILRKTIWKYLKRLSEDERVTVIVTTHHVEEARQANVVGLMRNGHLLAEASPDTLINHYEVSTLEEVFLKLCQRDQDDPQSGQNGVQQRQRLNISVGIEMPRREHPLTPFPLEGSTEGLFSAPSMQSMGSETLEMSNAHTKNQRKKKAGESGKRILALLWKDYMKLRRNVLITALGLLVPFIQVLLFGLSVGGELFDLPMALVNMEGTRSIGQDFLNSLSNETFTKRYFDDLETAIESTKKGETWGVVYINSSFSECLIERLSEGAEVTNDTIVCSRVQLYLDLSDYQVSVTIRMKLNEEFQDYVTALLTRLHMNPLMADPIIMLEDPVYGSEDTTFLEYSSPGMVIVIGYMAALTMSTMSLITEKRSGVYDRLLVAGVTSGEVISSLMIHMSLVVLAQSMASMICVVYVLSVPVKGSFFAAWGVSIISGVSAVSYGLFISAISPEENVAVMLALMMFIPASILSGILWPIEGMPRVLRYISYATPVTLSCVTFRSIMARGWSIIDGWMGPVVTTAWTLFFLTIVVLVLNVRRRKKS